MSISNCFICSKRVPFVQSTTNTCRCNASAVFCNKHKAAEDHACSFDYKKDWKDKVQQEAKLSEEDRLKKLYRNGLFGAGSSGGVTGTA